MAAVASALAVAVASGFTLRADRHLRDELVAAGRGLGLDDPALEREVRWAADGDRARIALGRALVFAGLGEGASAPAKVDPRLVATRFDRTLAVKRFERAAELGAEALAHRPTRREAATLAGAARYLSWSTVRDERLVREHERWEEPLLLSRRLGPGDREAARFLAMAYLELWSSLAESKRAEAREIVAVAFGDINTFYRLIDPWLAVAGTGDRGLAAVPPLPEAWTHLAERVAARGDGEAFCRVRERLAAATDARFDERLADARRRLAGGEPADARARLVVAIAEVPPEGRLVERVAAALGELPPGPSEPPRAAGLRAWVRFGLDQAALGRNPFEPPSWSALSGAAGLAPPAHDATDAVLALAAEAALAAGEVAAAERLEARAASLTGSTWSTYWLAKARVLGERKDDDGRRRALAALAVAAPGEAELAPSDLRHWPFEAWRATPEGARLSFSTVRSARGLTLELSPESATGGVALVRLDGHEVLCRPLRGPGVIVLAVPVEPGFHRLEVVTVKGLAGVVRAASLLPAAAAATTTTSASPLAGKVNPKSRAS